MKHILAIDQGTTSSRAILFDSALTPLATAQQELTQHFPAPGWVEHDPVEIMHGVLETCRAVISKAGIAPTDIAAIGITNQRETTIVWDRDTGRPIHNAIVWQDRRTAQLCQTLHEQGQEQAITEKTGLLLDPYFSASKIGWILDNVDGARSRARAGHLLFGTVDSFLIWHLTGGRVHATDATNAARTLLYDIRRGDWDADLCALFGVPMAMLPDVRDCAGDFGATAADLFGAAIPILGVAGDQQAAAIGQGCFVPGMVKSTYGTGCFMLMNTGDTLVTSQNRLLGTIAYQLGGRVSYALEGSIFNAGTVVQWLRDGLAIIDDAAQTDALAATADAAQDVILVPAFTGLGAPWWQPDCRGAIFGLTRNAGRAELARAALESVGYQTRDLLEAIQADWSDGAGVLRVDGGMAASDMAMQFLADITGAPVDRPKVLETTAIGAAWLAGMQAGLCPGMDDFAASRGVALRFEPQLDDANRALRYLRWKRAVQATIAAVDAAVPEF